MDKSPASYRGHRFPPEVISHAVWLYHRFCLSFRDLEHLLAERGMNVSYETIRHWRRKLTTEYARTLKRREGRLGDTWHLYELFVNIQGQRQYLWRAVDHDGDVIDILVQPRRDQRACSNTAADDAAANATIRNLMTLPLIVDPSPVQGTTAATSAGLPPQHCGHREVVGGEASVVLSAVDGGRNRLEGRCVKDPVDARTGAQGTEAIGCGLVL